MNLLHNKRMESHQTTGYALALRVCFLQRRRSISWTRRQCSANSGPPAKNNTKTACDRISNIISNMANHGEGSTIA